jgi:hypothetical protein
LKIHLYIFHPTDFLKALQSPFRGTGGHVCQIVSERRVTSSSIVQVWSVIAGDVASAACVGRALILIPVGQNETPFCLLGAVVLLRAKTAIEKFGHHWLGPEFRALGY